MGMMNLRRRVMGGNKNLPYDAEIEYLENPLGQSSYINTMILSSTNLDFKCKFITYDSLSDNNYGCILGGRLSSGNNDLQLTTYISPAYMYSYRGTLRLGNSSGNQYNAHIERNALCEFELNQDNYKVNGTSYQCQRGNITTQRDIYLFCLNNNNSPVQNGHGRIFYLQISQNGELLRDYIPVRVGTTGYLYDKVSGELFGNQGTGNFILGPDKN